MGQVLSTYRIKMKSLLLLAILITAVLNIGDSRHPLVDQDRKATVEEEKRLSDIWAEEEERQDDEAEWMTLTPCQQSCDLRRNDRCRLPQVRSWCQDNCDGC